MGGICLDWAGMPWAVMGWAGRGWNGLGWTGMKLNYRNGLVVHGWELFRLSLDAMDCNGLGRAGMDSDGLE